jgi:hypothetical protein
VAAARRLFAEVSRLFAEDRVEREEEYGEEEV